MARFGVTYADVLDATEQLNRQGISPTIHRIRTLLGKGSSTTIANHLKRLKQQQSPEKITPEFQDFMKKVWEHVQDTAAQETDSDNPHTKIARLETELKKYKANNRRWQKLYEAWLREREQLLQQKITLETALARSSDDLFDVSAQYHAILNLLQKLQGTQHQILLAQEKKSNLLQQAEKTPAIKAHRIKDEDLF